EIVEYAVGHGLVEGPGVAEGPDVELQALQLDAQPVRHVVENERREVRLARLRAQTGEFRYFHVYPVVPRGLRIGEGGEPPARFCWHLHVRATKIAFPYSLRIIHTKTRLSLHQ